MKHIAEIMERSLRQIETLAPAMKDDQSSTEALERSYQFQTFRNPQLVAMLLEAERFKKDATEGKPPWWLTFCGPSGAGKTHVASKLFNSLEALFSDHPSLLSGAKKITWQKLLPRLRNGDYWLVDDIRDANLILLDDFGTERPTEFSLEKLYEIIEARTRKWTILTCNLSLERISQLMDTRIASRLLRDGSKVLDIAVQDFNLRER